MGKWRTFAGRLAWWREVMTNAPPTITFASVVSWEMVRIAITLGGLNNLQVKVGDIENAYITAPCTEKVWTVLGPQFGSNAGK